MSSCPRILLQIPIHPAVLKKSADLVDCKGIPKHSLVKERKERTKSGLLRASRELREGVYTPIAMERVRKRLKGKVLRRSIAQKSPEAVGSKGVE